jgi:hypothetical protein
MHSVTVPQGLRLLCAAASVCSCQPLTWRKMLASRPGGGRGPGRWPACSSSHSAAPPWVVSSTLSGQAGQRAVHTCMAQAAFHHLHAMMGPRATVWQAAVPWQRDTTIAGATPMIWYVQIHLGARWHWLQHQGDEATHSTGAHSSGELCGMCNSQSCSTQAGWNC